VIAGTDRHDGNLGASEYVPTILEIGLGRRPLAARPLAANGWYVGVDIDEPAIRASAGCRIVADAQRLPMRSRSVEMVIARDVFGDVGLGHTFEEVTGFDPDGYSEYIQALVRRGAFSEAAGVRARIAEMTASVERTKATILIESARVLRPDGRILIVETLTPFYAEEFLRRHTTAARPRGKNNHKSPRSGLIQVDGFPFRCERVRGFARRRRLCLDDELSHRGLEVWLLQPDGPTRPWDLTRPAPQT
jgi:hypothetical protein